MKDNVSIIFATIFAVLLIVILPLMSILDRQDSMSYNVVLTATTKFVDNIRNNGFIDRQSYLDYISALTSTSNTYKVDMEIYRKRLVPDVESGTDTYVEDVEMFNSLDVLEVIEAKTNLENADISNEKSNVYLLKENDEVYFKVYNTNITAGSVIYKVFAGIVPEKVINISYGGVVNDINWELYEQINTTAVEIPQVIMEVPVNSNNETNIMKVTADDQLEEIDCNIFYDLCEDGYNYSEADQYTYLYDLSYEKNTEMTIAVELKNVDKIVVGQNADGSVKLVALENLTQSQFDAAKRYIINNYIQLNEMVADVDLVYRGRQANGYYEFNILLKDVEIASYELLSVFASVSVLPGLGQDVAGTLSLGAESVKVELVDESIMHMVTISDPINWKKFLKTKNVTSSTITNKEVFVNQEIAFIISYSRIKEEYSGDRLEAAIRDNLEIYNTSYKFPEGDYIITTEELKNTYNIDLNTRRVGHVLVRLSYISANSQENNYIKIRAGWAEKDINNFGEYEYEGYIPETPEANGAESSKYSIWKDDVAPVTPTLILDGIKGNDIWYRSDVKIYLRNSNQDQFEKNGTIKIGGVGVDTNIINVSYPSTNIETTEYLLSQEGTKYIYAKTCDYLNNCTDTKTDGAALKIGIDKTEPEDFSISNTGGKNSSANEWYSTDVTLRFEGNDIKDAISKIWKVTYSVNGGKEKTLNSQSDRSCGGLFPFIICTDSDPYYKFTISDEGINNVTIRVYDNAGNIREKTRTIKINKSQPVGVTVDLDGTKISGSDFYNSNVKVKISGNEGNELSRVTDVKCVLTHRTSAGTSTIISQSYDISESQYLELDELQKDGIYTLNITSYNEAGSGVSHDTITIKIDKSSPGISIRYYYKLVDDEWDRIYDNIDNNTWFTTKLKAEYYFASSNPDENINSSSLYSPMSGIWYTITKNGETGEEKKSTYTSTLNLELDDGIYHIGIRGVDKAGNGFKTTEKILIDTTPPISPEFVITGTAGDNGWYKSDVNISYTGGSDNVSGIKSIVLSQDKVTTNSKKSSSRVVPTTVTLTTTDNAGNVTTKTTDIKVDKTAPSQGSINFSPRTPTGTGITGVKLYNRNVTLTFYAGSDTFFRTAKYEIIGASNYSGTFSSSYERELKRDGQYTITVTTYDQAGNSSSITENIWINKEKPKTPTVSSINGETVSNVSNKTVTGTNNIVKVMFSNVEKGTLRVYWVNSETYESKYTDIDVDTEGTKTVSIELQAKGKYSIYAYQTNMFGTKSNSSSGTYYYEYK